MQENNLITSKFRQLNVWVVIVITAGLTGLSIYKPNILDSQNLATFIVPTIHKMSLLTMFILYAMAIILVVNWVYYSVFKLTRTKYYDPVQRTDLIRILKDPSVHGDYEVFQKKTVRLVMNYSNYLSEIIGAILPNAIKQPFMLEQYFRAKVDNINEKYIEGINTINLFSNIAPVVGFFGTLLGLIQAFRASSNAMLAEGQMTPESFATLQASIMIAIITSLFGVSLKIVGSIMRHHLVAQIPIEVLYRDFGRRQSDAVE